MNPSRRAAAAAASWTRAARLAVPYAVAGAIGGALLGALAWWPATWLAARVASASDGRLLLADARGTLWTGSAVAVLTGGPGSRDAAVLPGRLTWKLRRAPGSLGALELRLAHDCCLDSVQRVRIEPGIGRVRVALPAARQGVGRWPANWLVGLGTPWNTVQPGGTLRLVSEGLAVESVQGRWRVTGRAQLELLDVSSRLSTLDALGSYRIDIGGGGDAAALTLATLSGALQLSGSGQWGPGGLRFRGQASAQPGSEPVLNNLLNIIGRRQGSQAILSIG